MNYDERKDWYENGYTPMRKGRFWSFGSVNEIRGGKIAYWQPSFVRRINSNYKDVSLYGDSATKWSHSLLPTPTAPLSPLNYLLDPYYLENLHSEDRPYPVSGAMFEDGTPWGAILNPTLGALIKPMKLMHQDRLNSNLVDSKTLIEQRNRALMDKAKAQEGYLIHLRNMAIEPVKFTGYDAPTVGERVASVDRQQGEDAALNSLSDYGVYTGGAPVGDYSKIFSEVKDLLCTSTCTTGRIKYTYTLLS